MVQEHFSADEEAYRACEFIREETDRLNGLITSLLSLSRPADLRLQPVALETVIDRAVQLAAEELRRHEISVQQHHAQLPEVSVDPDLMAQVVLGLMMNAAEAIGEQGQIRIHTAQGHDDTVCIEVADTGPGVTPADAEHVFEPFFTTKPTGTGLGLPMAERIVRTHGGRIDLAPMEHNADKRTGACFRVHIPIHGPANGQGERL